MASITLYPGHLPNRIHTKPSNSSKPAATIQQAHTRTPRVMGARPLQGGVASAGMGVSVLRGRRSATAAAAISSAPAAPNATQCVPKVS